VWAERWLRRIQTLYVPEGRPGVWSGPVAVDVECLYRMLSCLDRHFNRRGAGLAMADASMMYVYRSRLSVTPLTSYRIVALATLLAMKVEDDDTMSNAGWAACVGLTLNELNMLEREFCESADWAFWLTPPAKHSICV